MHNKYAIRVGATAADAVALAPNLRDADKAECLKLYGVDPLDALAFSVVMSSASHAYLNDNGDVMGISGINNSGYKGVGTVWMVTSPEMVSKKYRVPFLREGRAILDEYNQEYDVLTNVVDPHNHVHIRWLQWMGCVFTTVLHTGPLGLPFIAFERRL